MIQEICPQHSTIRVWLLYPQRGMTLGLARLTFRYFEVLKPQDWFCTFCSMNIWQLSVPPVKLLDIFVNSLSSNELSHRMVHESQAFVSIFTVRRNLPNCKIDRNVGSVLSSLPPDNDNSLGFHPAIYQ